MKKCIYTCNLSTCLVFNPLQLFRFGIMLQTDKMKNKSTVEFIGNIIGHLFGLVLINSVLIWRDLARGIILDSWFQILWAANLSLLVQIMGNLLLAIYRPARLYWLLQSVHAGMNFFATLVFYQVFPLDFTPLRAAWFNQTLKILLLVAMLVKLISVPVNLLRAALGRPVSGFKQKSC